MPAYASTRPTPHRPLAHEFGATAAGSLHDAISGADAVDICTPTDTHHDIALAAVAAGAHVLCEKPLALGAADAEEMADAADAAGVRLYPGHVVRYFPAYARLRAAVAEANSAGSRSPASPAPAATPPGAAGSPTPSAPAAS